MADPVTMRWRIVSTGGIGTPTRIYLGDQDVSDLISGVMFTDHVGELLPTIRLELRPDRTDLELTTASATVTVTTDEDQELRTRTCAGCNHPNPGDSSGVCLVTWCNCTSSWHAPF